MQSCIFALESYGNCLFNGFASELSKKDKRSLSLAHFIPINQWSLQKVDKKLEYKSGGKTLSLPYKATYIIDQSTKDGYCCDSEKTVRLKCAAFLAATLIFQPLGLMLTAINKIAKAVTFAHFWHPSQQKCTFKACLIEWGQDIMIAASTPLIYIGLIFSGLYGATFSPYDGRKLCGSFERLAYSGGYAVYDHGYGKYPHVFILAPCFQPTPRFHLFGGDINKKDVW